MKKHSRADEQRVSTYPTTSSTYNFETIYQRYLTKVYRTCLSFTHDSQAAQDYTQDIFLKVFNKLDSFEHQSSFSTWLYAIAHNYCLDQHRLSKRLPMEPLSPNIVQSLMDSTPFAKEADEDQLRLLERLLEKLSPSDRRLLVLRYEQGLSILALSQHFQLSESAVKMRLKRSRDRLREFLDRAGDE
jgi:RNA polymerase sigma factor (sigma-70 family)